jgi:hypothetical protein
MSLNSVPKTHRWARMLATIIHAMTAEREMRMPKEREITRLAKMVLIAGGVVL